MNILDERNNLLEKINLLENIIDQSFDQHIIDQISIFKKNIDKELTFNILCLGDFSSGKSTFINSFFIGDNLLPTHDTTTTARLTTIKKGLPSLKIYKKDGYTDTFSDNFAEILSKSVSKEGSNIDVTDKVEISIETDLLQDGVVVVDSPGLNDPEVERMNVTYEYVNSADAIIYLIHSQQQYKDNEKKFLEENIYNKKDLDKLIFVVNFWDKMPDNQRDKTFKYIENQIESSIKKIRMEQQDRNIPMPSLFTVSSTTKENFDQLESVFKNYIDKIDKTKIINKKKYDFNILVETIINNIDEQIVIANSSVEELVEKIKKLEENIEKYNLNLINFNRELSAQIEDYFDSWIKELKREYYDITENIIKHIKDRLPQIDNVDEFKKQLKITIRKSIQKKEDSLEVSCKDFVKNTRLLIESKKANLNISSSKLIDTSLIINTMEYKDLISIRDIDQFRKPENLLQIIPTLFSHIFNHGDLKKEYLHSDILKNIDELEIAIEEEFSLRLNKLRNNMDDIILNIINNTHSDIKNVYTKELSNLDYYKNQKKELNYELDIQSLNKKKETLLNLLNNDK